MKFTFWWIGMGNKILFVAKKLPANIEKQKQDLSDEGSDRYKLTKAMAKFMGIWCFLIVGIYLLSKLKQ